MAEDVSILQEIDEALRADKAALFWARHSVTIIACCVLLVLSSAVTALWKNHVRQLHEEQTGKLAKASWLVETKKPDEAIKIFEQVEQEGGSLGAIAAMHHAQTLIDLKQEDKALAVYNDLAAGKREGTPELFRDYAALEADILAHNQALATGKPPVATQGGIEAREKGRAFAGAFAELDALRAADGKNAVAQLDAIAKDKDAPLSQRLRVEQMLDAFNEGAKK